MSRRPSRSARRPALPLGLWLWLGGFTLGGAVLAYAAFANAYGSVTQSRNPLAALRFNKSNAVALAVHADRLVMGSPSAVTEDRGEIADLAGRSLDDQAINPRALRVLAFTEEAAGNKAKARKLILLSDRLSRRDLPTQLWLIEDSAAQGDVPATLARYDVALRTDDSAGPVLYPILAGAIDDPAISAGLAKYVKQRADWLPEFADYVAHQQTDNLPAFAEILIRTGRLNSASLESAILAQLAEMGSFDVVRRYYATLSGASGAVLTSTDFDAAHIDPRFAPVTWRVQTGGDSSVGLEASRGGKFRFHVSTSANAREEVLRKLLLLAPGRYQFTARQTKTSSSEGSSAVWTLTCADGPLRSTKLFETGDTGTEVEIPASCKAQYLGLTVNGGTDSTGTELMVDEVRLRRL